MAMRVFNGFGSGLHSDRDRDCQAARPATTCKRIRHVAIVVGDRNTKEKAAKKRDAREKISKTGQAVIYD